MGDYAGRRVSNQRNREEGHHGQEARLVRLEERDVDGVGNDVDVVKTTVRRHLEAGMVADVRSQPVVAWGGSVNQPYTRQVGYVVELDRGRVVVEVVDTGAVVDLRPRSAVLVLPPRVAQFSSSCHVAQSP